MVDCDWIGSCMPNTVRSADVVTVLPADRTVFGMQLPIQSQSTIYAQPWEQAAGPGRLLPGLGVAGGLRLDRELHAEHRAVGGQHGDHVRRRGDRAVAHRISVRPGPTRPTTRPTTRPGRPRSRTRWP